MAFFRGILLVKGKFENTDFFIDENNGEGYTTNNFISLAY
jgi:hypothetical protein